jgi:PPOX class probable F420-dependent enzyme
MSHPPTVEELEFVAARRVGRLATANASARPSVVPFCFAVIEHDGAPAIVTSIDEKPKSGPFDRIQRVRNLRENGQASVVVDDYNEDWSRLRFVQLTGSARVIEPKGPLFDAGVVALRAKYPQYERMAIHERPMIVIEELTAISWRSSAETVAANRPDELISLIQGRRSVRALRPEPPPRALIEQAISAAGWAPSPHGRQPWRFSVVESVERKQRLVDDMAATWLEQLKLDGQDETVVAIRLQKSRQRLLEAPVIIVPCLYLDDLDDYPDESRRAAERLMAVQSLGAAIQNLLLSIYSVGLDAGWMCAPLFCPDVVRDALGLDHSLIPQALIPTGYAAKDPVRRPRLPLDQLIVDWS